MEKLISRVTELDNDRVFAKRKLRRNILENWYRDHPDELVEDMDPDWYKRAVDDYQESIGKRFKWIFWTINPRAGVDLDAFHNKIRKCVKKKWIGYWEYCIEQRGADEDDAGLGMHCHILTEISEKKNPYHCRREVYNTFKGMIGNKMHVIPRYSHKPDSFVKYIRGQKKDRSKDLKTEIDRLWRLNNNLSDVYCKPENDAL